jgi:hypothetical protein
MSFFTFSFSKHGYKITELSLKTKESQVCVQGFFCIFNLVFLL